MSDAGPKKLSGRQIALHYVERFKRWIAERDVAGDWDDYIRFDKLNRTEVADECDFDRTIFRTNPGVERELIAVEARLRKQGVLPELGSTTDAPASSRGDAPGDDLGQVSKSADHPAVLLALRRAMAGRANAEKRAKALEEQNATLRAEVKHLRDQVRKLSFMDELLAQTGRLPRP